MTNPQILYDNYYTDYNKDEVMQFFKELPIETNLKNKKLYISSGVISQFKLRESGFTITRNKLKADVIVIEDIRKYRRQYYTDVFRIGNSLTRVKIDKRLYFSEICNDVENNNLKYCFINDLYKYLYKYDANFEIFTTFYDLLNSNDSDNIKTAMEMMTNCNWEGHSLYLVELFNLFYKKDRLDISHNSFRHSVSFSTFLDSLDFDYDSIYLNNPDDYRIYCTKQEHHDYIFNKYKDEFEYELKFLFNKYKLQIDNIKYSISYELNNENSN